MISKSNLTSTLLLFSMLFLVATSLMAEVEQNVLLERSFWKSKPSLSLVKSKIADGHNPSELNSNAFDPVVYSIFEDSSFELIKFLIEQEGNGVNKITHDGRSYIFWASYKNNLDLVNYLIQQGTNTKLIDDHGNSILNFAAVSGVTNTNLYDLLIEHGAEPKTDLNPDAANALHLIIPHLENSKMIEYFNSHGVELLSTDKNGNGLFQYAAQGGNFEVMDWLISQKIPHQNLNAKGENALFFASRGFRRHANTIEVFQYLREKGIDPSMKSSKGSTCLIEYCKRASSLDVIQFLIQSGVDVNQVNSEGNNALLVASKRADLKTIQIISSLSENPNINNAKGETALGNAMAHNNVEIANYLIEFGCSINMEDKKGNNILYYWVQSYSPKDSVDFYQKLELLKSASFNFSLAQPNKSNLYHLAVKKGNMELLQLSSNLTANINEVNLNGMSPLHLAAMISKDDFILQYLVNQGADKNLQTSMGESAYELAQENEVLTKKNISLNFLKD